VSKHNCNTIAVDKSLLPAFRVLLRIEIEVFGKPCGKYFKGALQNYSDLKQLTGFWLTFF
jgi:hypothetical protein